MNITIKLDGLDKAALRGLAKALEGFYYSEEFNCPACDSCGKCPIRETCDSILHAKNVCRRLGDKA